jgi:hypothetical protein
VDSAINLSAQELGRGECLGVIGKVFLRSDFYVYFGTFAQRFPLLLDKNNARGVIDEDTFVWFTNCQVWSFWLRQENDRECCISSD